MEQKRVLLLSFNNGVENDNIANEAFRTHSVAIYIKGDKAYKFRCDPVIFNKSLLYIQQHIQKEYGILIEYHTLPDRIDLNSTLAKFVAVDRSRVIAMIKK